MSLPENTLHSAPPSDPRHFARHAVAVAATVRLVSMNGSTDGGNVAVLSLSRPACVEDLSLNGLRLISPAAFPVGAIVGVRLRLGVRPYELQALVHWRREQPVSGKPCYEIGAQMVRSEQTPQAVVALAVYLKSLKRPAPRPEAAVSAPADA